MAEDGANTVASFRYPSRQRNKKMLLESLAIDQEQANGSSHFTCQPCDQSFPNIDTLESHSLLCSNKQLDSLKNKGSSNRRNKTVPRKIDVSSVNNCSDDKDIHLVASEENDIVSPSTSRSLTDDDRDQTNECNDNKELFSLGQDRLDDANANAAVAIDGPCSCDICHKNFSGTFALKAHNYYHHGMARRTFPCKLCPRQFKWEAILKRHVNIFHGRRERRCNVGFHSTTAKNNSATTGETGAQLRENVELVSSEGYKCTTCSNVFGSLSAVRLHRFSAHGTGPRQVCKFCNNSYRPCHFARHCCWSKKGRHNAASSALSLSSLDTTCLICQDFFPTQSLLEDHMQHNHSPRQGDKLEDLLSGNGTSEGIEGYDQDDGLLSLSSLAGLSTRKAECPVCHKMFKNRGSLGMHRWRHHSIQKQFCTCCRKSYLASQFSSHICSASSSDADNKHSSSSAAVNSSNAAAYTDTRQCANLSLVPFSPNATSSGAAAAAQQQQQSICDMCSRQYATDHSLKEHMRVVHGVYQRIAGKNNTTSPDANTTRRQNGDTEQYGTNNGSTAHAARPSSAVSEAHSTSLSPEYDRQFSPSHFLDNQREASPLLAQSPVSPPPTSADANVVHAPEREDNVLPPPSTDADDGQPNITTATSAAMSTSSAASPAAGSGSAVGGSGGDCECVTCHRVFKNSSALRLHRFSAHGACPRRLCSKCNKSFLPWHYLRHACAGAGGAGLGGEPMSETATNALAASPRGPESAEIISSSPPIEWRCTMCERRYLSRRTLKDHLRVVHGVYQRRNVDSFLPTVPSQQQQPVAEAVQVSSPSSSGVLDLSCPNNAKRLRLDQSANDLASRSDVLNYMVNSNVSGGGNPKSYKCGICYKPFRDIAALRKHRYSAHGTCPKKMCPRCKKFLLPWHVKRHCCYSSATTTTTGGPTTTNDDSDVPMPLSDENGLEDGSQEQSDSLQPQCNLCHRRYANDHTLKCHLRVIHGVYQRNKGDGSLGSSATVSTEDNTTEKQSSPVNNRLESPLSSPEKTSSGKPKLQLNLNGNECGVCHKVFQSHGAARLHLFSAHGACPKRHCATCNKWYLPWHYSRHFCQNAAAQAAVTAANATANSGNAADDATAESSSSPLAQWKCDSCDRQYLSHRTLKDHLRIAHGIYQTRRPSSAAGTQAGNASSARPSSHQGHNDNETPPPSSPTKAHPVPGANGSPSTQAPPTPSTEGNKNPGFTVIGDPSSPLYECDICSKVFKSSSAARLHRLSGHGACPKRVCPNCNKSFLPCHFARHSCTGVLTSSAPAASSSNNTDSAPAGGSSTESTLEWRCHLCERRYQSSRTLKDHLRIGHGVYQTRNRGSTAPGGGDAAPQQDNGPLELTALDNNARVEGSSTSPSVGNVENATDEGGASELQQLLSGGSATAPPTASSPPLSENECDICHKSFKNSSALRLHRYVTHVSRRRQLCTRCNKSFLPCHFPRHCCWSTNTNASAVTTNGHPEAAKKSVEVNAEEKSDVLLKCEFCPNGYLKEEALKHHLELEHGVFNQEDVHAAVAVAEDARMDVSFKTEPGDAGNNTLEPSFSNAKSSDSPTMYGDDGLINDDDADVIDVGATSAAGSAANTPTNGYKCGICHMPFSNLTDVRKHRYSVHGACPKRICPKCNKAILPCHFSRHSCDPASPNTAVAIDPPQQQQQEAPIDESSAAFEWKCDLCERRYLSRRTLNDHRRVAHGLYQRRPIADDGGDGNVQEQMNTNSDDEPMPKALASADVAESHGIIPSEAVKMEADTDGANRAGNLKTSAEAEADDGAECPQSSLIVFPGPEGFGNEFLAFKQPKVEEDGNEDMSFEDPLAMVDAVVYDGAETAGQEGQDYDVSAAAASVGGTEQCTICSKTFKSSSALRLHRFSAHGTCPKRECPKCNKSFLPWHFTRHCCWNKDDEQQQPSSSGNSVPADSSSSAVASVDSSMPATCDLCRRSYTSARTLKEHMRTVHGVYQRKSQPVSLVPPQQPAAAHPPTTSTTNNNERPPSSASPVIPNVTASTAVNEDETAAAKDAVAAGNSQNYECPDCNVSFTAPFDLLLHRLTHTGDKPFVCPDCKEAFAMPQELDGHRKTVHAKDG